VTLFCANMAGASRAGLTATGPPRP